MTDPAPQSYATQDELDASSDWNHLTFTWARGIAVDIDGDALAHSQLTYVPFSKTATDSNSNTVTYSEGLSITSNTASYFNGLSDSDYVTFIKTELAGDPDINNWLQEKLNA